MEISYNKLWKLLIDKGMNKTDLRFLAHLSSGTMAKLGKNENVTTDILVSTHLKYLAFYALKTILDGL